MKRGLKMRKSGPVVLMVDPDLYRNFKEACKEAGISTCEAIELFFKEFKKT
jgi:hypothetical protein